MVDHFTRFDNSIIMSLSDASLLFRSSGSDADEYEVSNLLVLLTPYRQNHFSSTSGVLKLK